MDWEVIDTGISSAEENMRFDAEMLEKLQEKKRPVLHLYDWKQDSITYGLFVDPAAFLNLKGVEEAGFDLAKRPTGGGIVFHAWDLAFSVLVPASDERFSNKTLANYEWVNTRVLAAAKEFVGIQASFELTPVDAAYKDDACQRFCMARPTKYDVVWQGRKIAGAAQRKTRDGFLHQGTIALVLPPQGMLNRLLQSGTHVEEALFAHTYPLMGSGSIEEARKKLKTLLQKHICQ
jgi:lipoate-protein ligase A